ncbi:universal stress protein [Streptomyces erythrochromogenes]|uniref:Universal stress protein n=1 Tax=Streptomyces erythrochromogenes TaxID=285574 RepID=A0ABZ1QPU4_9ACTN|nr:universal stress protein [Streptomyces erythrochromogenes]MCX5588581.1 universal stress protein [Streptomyces erythrochromogenes]
MDGSPQSRAAADWAAREAVWRDLPLHVVHAWLGSRSQHRSSRTGTRSPPRRRRPEGGRGRAHPPVPGAGPHRGSALRRARAGPAARRQGC